MQPDSQLTIRLNAGDNVVVARGDIPRNQEIFEEKTITREPIPAGHKIAVREIPKGEVILKYGQIIGTAAMDIHPGDHVHTHNTGMTDFAHEYAGDMDGSQTDPTATTGSTPQAVFDGIVRADGRVGTRNYIGIMASSGCAASVVRFIAQAFHSDRLSGYPHVDGVVPIVHGSGCGLAAQGEGIELLRRTLVGWARHPNFAGVLLVGHGCEVNQVDLLAAETGIAPGTMFNFLNIQSSGGTRSTLQRGIDAVSEMLSRADSIRRQPVDAAHLMVGLECGGSDAFSGITANPALGYAADLLVHHGGTAILSETPEIYGAEQLLLQRAVSKKVGEKLMARIHWWEAYARRNGIELNNNPSPGNKAGGLTTILEKSLGAVAKSGSSPFMDVFGYAEPVTTKGLVFMDTPGYDLVSVTGKIAGGANMICFTTGRGSVFGSKPVPTLKLATNSTMYHHMEEDMDINCGDIVEGQDTIEQVGKRVFEVILETASGRKSKSEALGFGDSEFTPWMIGATL